MRRFILRLLNVFRPNPAEDDLDREVASHLALLEDEYLRRGLTPEEARFAARRAMGSVALAKDLHRDALSLAWLEDFRQDIAHTLRALRRMPGFAAVVVLTLAVGIGASTSIFGVVNAVLLKPLPYPNSRRLVELFEVFPAVRGDAGTPDRGPAMDVQTIAAFRLHSRTLSHVGVHGRITRTLKAASGPFRIAGSEVSPDFLAMLDARPLVGRIFERREEIAGAERVIVLSEDTWRRHFDGRPDVVGRPAALDGEGYSIVGVLRRGFYFYPHPEAAFWIPFVPPVSGFEARGVIARVRDGVSTAAAASEMTAILKELRGPAAAGDADPQFALAPVVDRMIAPVRPALLVLAVAVGLVLLIACVNVANLMLAHIASRRLEIGVRRSLGAGRGRLVRQFLTESVVLSSAGAACGVVLAFAGLRLLQRLGTTLPRGDVGSGVTIPRLGEIGIDATVIAFAVIAALGACVLLACAAVGRWSRQEIDVLREEVPIATLSRQRLRSIMVVAEVAMAMMLLVAGGLLIHSFVKLTSVDPGYDASNLLTFQTLLPPNADIGTFADTLVTRLRSLPGIRAAGYAAGLPMIQGRGFFPLRLAPPAPSPPGARAAPPRSPPRREDAPDPKYVSQGYLEAMGIRVVKGRSFGDQDRAGAPQVMLVNRTLARSGLLGANPLGTPVYALFRNPWEIVGIVDDVRQFGLDREPHPQFFIDFRQVPGFPFAEFRPYFAVRTEGDPAALAGSIRAIALQLDSQAVVDNVATMEQLVANSVSRPRLYAAVLGGFAGIAVTLAAIGIFGAIAYSVSQRTREIGIRVALGATRAEVMRLVVGQSVKLTGIGIGLGLLGSGAASRSLEGLLFGVTAMDPLTVGGVCVLFFTVAMAATYVPARRATHIDPVIALRTE